MLFLCGHHERAKHEPEYQRVCQTLDATGCGALTPRPINTPARLFDTNRLNDFYGTMHKFNDNLAWLEDDLAAIRIYDTLRALDVIEEWQGLDASDIWLYAHGKSSLYGRLAALLDERIRSVEVVNGIRSYSEFVAARHYDAPGFKSLVLHAVLEYFDLPEMGV